MTQYLNAAYKLDGPEDTQAHYDTWAASYDQDVSEHGYATPERCAAALAAVLPDLALPVLDFGCGTGISGQALMKSDFQTLDGVDISDVMLAKADALGIYRSVRLIGFDEDPIPTPGTYAAIAAIGVIGAGAAPVTTFDTLMRGLSAGGFLVVSFNDHTLEDPAYEGRISEWIDSGAARLLFKEHGPHLPGIDLSSTVYVIEKA